MAGVDGSAFQRFTGPRGRLTAAVFELSLAIMQLLTGVAFLVSPVAVAAHSPIGRHVHPWDVVWSVALVTGAVLIVAGVFAPNQPLRVLGLSTLATGLLMQFAVAVLERVEPRTFVYLLWAVACWWRAAGIVRFRRQFRLGA